MIVWGFLELMTAAFADLQHNKAALFIHSNSASKKKVYLSQLLPHNFVLKCLPKIFNKNYIICVLTPTNLWKRKQI